MSVLIKGMEMPKPGQIVLVEIDENGDVFAAYDGGRTKLAQYKAIPVPPHGDLIDRNVAYDKIAEQDGGNYVDMDAVDMGLEATPVVIPAEEETNDRT